MLSLYKTYLYKVDSYSRTLKKPQAPKTKNRRVHWILYPNSHWPEQCGEDKSVIMLEVYIIEMAALQSIGTLLQDSGWAGVLVQKQPTLTTAQSQLRTLRECQFFVYV